MNKKKLKGGKIMKQKFLAITFALTLAVIFSGAVAATNTTNNSTFIQQNVTHTPTNTITNTNSSTSNVQTPIKNTPTPDPTDTRTGIHYTTIQAAINSVFTQNGNTIDVEAGNYPENVLVWKTLNILATGPATVDSFYITSTGNGSEISGFNVTGGTGEAITLNDTNNVNIL